jgi:formate/nitrite transporter FocA (FNT family)
MVESSWKVNLARKLLFSMLAGLFVAIGYLAVLGVGIVARWWAVPPASTVLWLAGGTFAAAFFVVFVWLLEISYYVDHDRDVI